jgi:hypothetical protein
MSEKYDIDALIACLDGTGSATERQAINELRETRGSIASVMREAYERSTSAKTRSSCLFYAISDARNDPAAVGLATLALSDRSKIVRYRALMLLAFAQSDEAKEVVALFVARRPEDADGAAALDALVRGNADYFVDRRHTGNIKLVVGSG